MFFIYDNNFLNDSIFEHRILLFEYRNGMFDIVLDLKSMVLHNVDHRIEDNVVLESPRLVFLERRLEIKTMRWRNLEPWNTLLKDVLHKIL